MRRMSPVLVMTSVAALLLTVPQALAGDAKWSGSLGLSFNSTSGNTSTSSLGLDLGLKLAPNPWGGEATLSWLRSELDNDEKANRLAGRLRGQRELDQYWTVFAGLTAERDIYAGFDLRASLEAGVTYKILLGPKHELAVDGGLTRTHENLADHPHGPGGDRNYWGGLAGVAYTWHFSANGSLTERAVFYPNFTDSSNWRITSDTAVQAKLSDTLALKLGYSLRRANEPPEGVKHKTDTATTASLVVSF